MNLKQYIALGLGAANFIVIWLFPPFDSFSFTDIKTLIFAGFHYRFSNAVNEVINSDVLFLEIVVLLVNVAVAWLLLRDDKTSVGPRKLFNYQISILLGVAINLTVILLFPPFQFFYALSSALLPTFQGFYFIFMAGPMLTIVTPVLYMEVVFVLFNGSALWLLFNRIHEREISTAEAARYVNEVTSKQSE